MIYFTLLNDREKTHLILEDIRQHCGIHSKFYERDITTHVLLGSRYTAMILTDDYNDSTLHIYAKSIEDKTHIIINLKNINSILEMN